jgi:hypothetical protein
VSYFAELDADNVVLRVVVADSIEWCIDNLGGTWAETSDPYAEPTAVTYCGPGYGHDPAVRERFALPWDETAATIPNAEGHWAHETQGEVVFHAGKIWRNLMPDGNPNVWEPGVANWREYPMGTLYPLWIQPVGSVDAYALGELVEYNGEVWVSTLPANVWAPDVTGWEHPTSSAEGVVVDEPDAAAGG